MTILTNELKLELLDHLIDYVIDYEKANFGETNTKINSEAIVNMLAYILGEELINSLDIDLDTCTKYELWQAITKAKAA